MTKKSKPAAAEPTVNDTAMDSIDDNFPTNADPVVNASPVPTFDENTQIEASKQIPLIIEPMKTSEPY
jgi:hypothetical protein